MTEIAVFVYELLVATKRLSSSLTVPLNRALLYKLVDLGTSIVPQACVEEGHDRVTCDRINCLTVLQDALSKCDLLLYFILLVKRARFGLRIRLNSRLSVVGYS